MFLIVFSGIVFRYCLTQNVVFAVHFLILDSNLLLFNFFVLVCQNVDFYPQKLQLSNFAVICAFRCFRSVL